MTSPDHSAPGATAPTCALLRSKGNYLPENPKADGATPGGSSTAVWWCLKTMKMMGPDEGYVAPDTCIAGRSCFRSPE